MSTPTAGTPRKPDVVLREDSILAALADGPMNSDELAKALGLESTYSKHFGRELRYVLNDMVYKKLIDKVNPHRERLQFYGVKGDARLESIPAPREARACGLPQTPSQAAQAVSEAVPPGFLKLGAGKPVGQAPQDQHLVQEPTRNTIYEESSKTTADAQLESKVSLSSKVSRLKQVASANNNKSLQLVAETLDGILAAVEARGPAEAPPEVAEDADEVEVALAVLVSALKRDRKGENEMQAQQVLESVADLRARVDALAGGLSQMEGAVKALAANVSKVNSRLSALKEAL